MNSWIPKIVSGGQTGADRAALDWALSRRVECVGWCPKGRKAEDGPIPSKYPLVETPSRANHMQPIFHILKSGGARFQVHFGQFVVEVLEALGTEACSLPS